MEVDAPIILRPYQVAAADALRGHAKANLLRLLLAAETGSGKSIIALELIRCCVNKGKRALFIARGRDLVNQFSRHLWGWGIPHGVIMRGEEWTPANVQVASKDTLVSWCGKRKKEQLPPADLVIADEAHESMSAWFKWLLEQYAASIIIGLTATPCLTDGRGMGDTYQAMVQVVPRSRLIAEGYLVPTRAFAPYVPDLKGVQTHAGDYNKRQVNSRMDKMELVGDIVQHWRELGEDRPTAAYTTSVAHSLHIVDEFKRAGIPAVHIDADTEDSERQDVVGNLTSGRIKIVSNVGIWLQGKDIPCLSCCIDAAPTKSLLRARQKWGRIGRPFEDKADAILLDHSGNAIRHGHPDCDIEWELKETVNVQREREKKRDDGREPRTIVCVKCHAVYSGKPACPNCGHVPARARAEKAAKRGKLVEIQNDVPAEQRQENLVRAWHQILGVAAYKGWPMKRAYAVFISRTGEKPWQIPGLPNVPRYNETHLPVSQLYPQYVHRRRA